MGRETGDGTGSGGGDESGVYIDEDTLYEVCVMLLREKRSAMHVARWLQARGVSRANRQTAAKLLALAHDRKVLKLEARPHADLGGRLEQLCKTITRVSPLWGQCPDPAAEAAVRDSPKPARRREDASARGARRAGVREMVEDVAYLAADMVLGLIGEAAARARPPEEPSDGRVHVGFSAGLACSVFARHLARLIRERGGRVPPLTLHTLTPGFTVDRLHAVPVASLAQFADLEPAPEYVMLHASPVREQGAGRPEEDPYLHDAKRQAEMLDIVVTSVSVADHDHSLFQAALHKGVGCLEHQALADLRRERWVADIGWAPFDVKGRALRPRRAPVSVLDFDGFVQMANTDGRSVVCIAGPCGECGAGKKDAVVPLLNLPKSRRPFSHLVTTRGTATELVAELDRGR